MLKFDVFWWVLRFDGLRFRFWGVSGFGFSLEFGAAIWTSLARLWQSRRWLAHRDPFKEAGVMPSDVKVEGSASSLQMA